MTTSGYLQNTIFTVVILTIQIKPCTKAMCEYQRFISNTVARNSNLYKLEHVFEIHNGETK